MKLKAIVKLSQGTLLNKADLPKNWQKETVTRLTIDSRKVKKGMIFVACPGATKKSKDGHDFIKQVKMKKPACIFLTEAKGLDLTGSIPLILIKHARSFAAKMSEKLNQSPSKKIKITAVTGTNGKTSVCFIASAILDEAKQKNAIIGTLGYGKPGKLKYFGMTTPEAETISQALNGFKKKNIINVFLEATSIGLETKRLDGLNFKNAAFTNLSNDHLDFHHDMKRYKAAKDRLFKELLPKSNAAILPAKHPLKSLLKKRGHPVLTWGYNKSSDIYATNIKHKPNGIEFLLHIKSKNQAVKSKLYGDFNLENMLCASAVAYNLKVPLKKIAKGLNKAILPPGRLENIRTSKNKLKPTVLVDFAHTPDALQKALHTVRRHARGKVILVFGCGGDRDKSKRATMGKIATSLSDHVFVTNDNPRSENPDLIVRDITSKLSKKALAKTAISLNRKKAIHLAIKQAKKEDIVLIAGKGHETTQIAGGKISPFSDRKIAKEYLESKYNETSD